MPSTLWEDIKKTVKEGVSVAAEKTEEYTKIGKVKVDVLNIKRNIEKLHEDLGKEVYRSISTGKKADLASNEKVAGLVKKLDDQNEMLKKKEKEIEKIKKEAEKKTQTRKESAETKKTTEEKSESAGAGKTTGKTKAKPAAKPKPSSAKKPKSGE